MKPSLPYHATTSLHRAPAGLRTLDLIIERINSYADLHPDQALQILIYNDEQANFSLPIASLGYSVTALFGSETAAKKAEAFCTELGIDVKVKVNQLSAEQSSKYDIILSPHLPSSTVQITNNIKQMLDKVKAHGSILFNAKVDEKVKRTDLLSAIKEAGSRVYSSQASSFLSKNFFDKHKAKLKKGSTSFHFVDVFDGWLANGINRRYASGWVFDCRKKNASKLVTYIVPTLSAGGGAERLVMQLAARMSQHDFESHVIANVRGGGLELTLREQNISYTIINRRGIFGRLSNLAKQKHLLEDLNPDIVHTNLFAADVWGRIAAHRAKVKHIVTTLHNVRIRFNQVGIFLMRVLKGFSQKYIAISNDVASYIEATLKVKKQDIVTIPNGIEISKITKRQNRPFKDVPHFLFIGRLEPQKNPDILLYALAEVRGSWECSIYGEGSMENDLKHLADELGILPRIYWKGVVPDASDVYSKHDIFILPSAWEGFGLVAVEAAVAGIPMIVSDLPVMRELFAENVAKVSPGSVEDLTLAIEDMLDRPAEAITRAQRLSARDFSKYSIDKMADDHVELYNSLLNS